MILFRLFVRLGSFSLTKFVKSKGFNRLVGGLALTKNGQPTLMVWIHEDFYVSLRAYIQSGQKVHSQEYRDIATVGL